MGDDGDDDGEGKDGGSGGLSPLVMFLQATIALLEGKKGGNDSLASQTTHVGLLDGCRDAHLRMLLKVPYSVCTVHCRQLPAACPVLTPIPIPRTFSFSQTASAQPGHLQYTHTDVKSGARVAAVLQWASGVLRAWRGGYWMCHLGLLET